MTDRPLPGHRYRTGLIGALDVGTDKIVCLIARGQEDGTLRVTGYGHQVSAGMRNGAITDLDATEAAVREAVDAAEHMAGERLQKVVVGIAGGHLSSRPVRVAQAISGQAVRPVDVKRLHQTGVQQHQETDRTLLHLLAGTYEIDGNAGIHDPHGMVGQHLSATVYLVSAAAGVTANLVNVLDRCLLEPETVVAAPYGSGLAALEEDERDLGVTVIDMGCGTTTMAVFVDGAVVHVDSLPVGGGHVTRDIARGLTTPLGQAERMKTLFGSCMPSLSDEREMIQVPMVGENADNATNSVPRSMLTAIIQPRIEETLELVRSHLADSGVDRVAGRQVVLVGGASQLQGVRELASHILDKHVRLGRPLGFSGLPAALEGPAFATAAGLLRHAQVAPGALRTDLREPSEPKGPLGRMARWFRNNF